MDIQDKDLSPNFGDNGDNGDRPFLTNEQYARMATLHARIRDLKQAGFDIREYLDPAKQEIIRLEAELEKYRVELAEKAKEIQECFEEYVHKPYNIQGQITVADTEPHYISVISPS